MTDSQDKSIKPAVVPVCQRCGAKGGYIRRRSVPDLVFPKPMLCLKCQGRWGQ